MEIVIGDKVWSSWSMRPWLVLKHTGEAFTETLVHLRTTETEANIRAAGSPSGQVPVLKDGQTVIWDSLAICEYLADRFPNAKLWPDDPVRRALGRAAAAEMHAGFPSLRGECPMDLSLASQVDLSEATNTDLRRVVALWNDLRGRFAADGPFLLGAWSIVDAYYTPVATRLRSYGILPSDHGDTGPAGAYAEALLQTPEFKAWETGALVPAP